MNFFAVVSMCKLTTRVDQCSSRILDVPPLFQLRHYFSQFWFPGAPIEHTLHTFSRVNMGQGHITVDGKTEDCFKIDPGTFPGKVASLKIRLAHCFPTRTLERPDPPELFAHKIPAEAGSYIGTAFSGALIASTVLGCWASVGRSSRTSETSVWRVAC